MLMAMLVRKGEESGKRSKGEIELIFRRFDAAAIFLEAGGGGGMTAAVAEILREQR